MSIRYIVRPNTIRATPKRLKRVLRAERIVNIYSPVSFDWSKDLFLAYPPSHSVLSADPVYDTSRSFFKANKLEQRKQLFEQGLPIVPTLYDGVWLGPWSGPNLFVFRPFFHRGGQGFVLTDNRHYEGEGYLSEYIDKKREFRVIYYKGERVCTYLKKKVTDTNTPVWNHRTGFVFQTIRNDLNDKLLNYTDVYTRLQHSSLIKSLHLCAIDILYKPGEAYITEVNLCPGLTIPSTLEKISSLEV